MEKEKKVKFKTATIEGFTCEEGKSQTFYRDTVTPSLGVRVTAKGTKSYIFEVRLPHRIRRTTIGDTRTWTIAQARAEATRLKVMADQGIDPKEHKDRQQAAAKAARTEAEHQRRRDKLTLADVWPEYLAYGKSKPMKSKGRIGWSESHYQSHVWLSAAGGEKKKRRGGEGVTKAGPLYALMPLPLSQLTGAAIAKWLKTERQTRPTAAALAYRVLRAFIRWAAEEEKYKGIVPVDAYSARAVSEAVPKSTTKDEDVLQREQLPVWFAAIRRINNPVISAYLQGLLLTGARRSELSSLKWADVDFTWRTMNLHDKVEGTRKIPLTPYLASLLNSLPRRNQWVFSSPTAQDGKIAEPRIAHVEALKAAGLPHVSLHGLRRSFATLSEWVEVPVGAVAQIMGHKPSALAEKHYRRRPIDLLRKWHDIIEKWILEQAGIDFEPAEPGLRVVS